MSLGGVGLARMVPAFYKYVFSWSLWGLLLLGCSAYKTQAASNTLTGVQYYSALAITQTNGNAIRLTDPTPTNEAYALYEFNIPINSSNLLCDVYYKTEDGIATAEGGTMYIWRWDADVWEATNDMPRSTNYGWACCNALKSRHISDSGTIRIRLATKEYTHLWVSSINVRWTPITISGFTLGDSYVGLNSDQDGVVWYGLSGTYNPYLPTNIVANQIRVIGTDVKTWPGYGVSESCDYMELIYKSYQTGNATGQWKSVGLPWTQNEGNGDKWGAYGDELLGPFNAGQTVEIYFRGYGDGLSFTMPDSFIYTNWDNNNGLNYKFIITAPHSNSAAIHSPTSTNPAVVVPGDSYDVYYSYNVGDDPHFTATGGVRAEVTRRLNGITNHWVYNSILRTGLTSRAVTNAKTTFTIDKPYYDDYGKFDIDLVVTTGDNGANSRGSHTFIAVTNPLAVAVNIDGNYGGNIVFLPAELTQQSGAQTVFTMTVSNTSSVSDSYTISFSGPPYWTYGNLPYGISLSAGASKQYTNCWVRSPTNATDGGRYNTTFYLMSSGAGGSSVASKDLYVTISEPKPDFVISDFQVQPVGASTGQLISIKATVLNQGTASGDAGTLYLRPDTYWYGVSSNKPIGTLNAGASTTATFSNVYTPLTAGVYTAETYIDSENITTEINETNNQAYFTYAISASTNLADFVITNIVLTPSTPTSGIPFSATVTVKNQGNVSGNGGQLSVWINKSSAVSVGDVTYSASYSVGTLTSKQSHAFSFTNLTPPSVGGPYTFRAFVDSGGDTSESSEDNNQHTVSYLVTDGSHIAVMGRWLYVDRDTGKTNPVRFAKTYLYDNEVIDSPIELARGYTDSNGYYTFSGISNSYGPLEGGVDLYVKVDADYGPEDNKGCRVYHANDLMQGNYSSTTFTNGNTQTTVVDFGSYLITMIDSQPWTVYDAAITAYLFHKSFGFNTDKVPIAYPYDNQGNSFFAPLATILGFSVPIPDYRIYIYTPHAVDRSVVFHEYSHAVMYKLYGNGTPAVDILTLILTTPEDHTYGSEVNPAFALTDGWAEFCAARMLFIEAGEHRGDVRKLVIDNFEDQGEKDKTVHWADNSDHANWLTLIGSIYEADGASVEGAVAEALWDLTDAGDQDTDGDEYSGNALTNIINILHDTKPNGIKEVLATLNSYEPGTSHAVLRIAENAKIVRSSDECGPEWVCNLSFARTEAGSVEFNWDNPTDTDFRKVLILKSAKNPAILDTPEPLPQNIWRDDQLINAFWIQGNDRGHDSLKVAYLGSGNIYTDTSMTYSTDAYYQVFTLDSSGNCTPSLYERTSILNAFTNHICYVAATDAPEQGSLQVNIIPENANTAGARWKLSGSSMWRTNGAVVMQLSTGMYSVACNDLSGWITPTQQPVFVNNGQVTTASVSYGIALHYVSKPSLPTGLASANKGAMVNFLTGNATCAQGHAVEYRFDYGDGWRSAWSTSSSASHSWEIPGTYLLYAQARCKADSKIESEWSRCSSINIVDSGESCGNVLVNIVPSDISNNGALWRVDNGAWQSSGTPLDDITVGQHLIKFSALEGWIKPLDIVVSVQSNSTNMLIGTYERFIIKQVNSMFTADPGLLLWDAVSGRWYSVNAATSLLGNWTNVFESYSSGGEMRFTNDLTNLPSRFFRIQVREP